MNCFIIRCSSQCVPLLCETKVVVFGAITPNNSTNSISDIQTLPLEIFTLPFSLIVIIALSIVTLLLKFH